MGMVLSASRRVQLLDWARRSGAWIIEDDYDSEYRYESQPIASLQGLDRDARVLYVGTFSKVLFPALRLGYLVLPPDLVPRFAAVRDATDIFPPTFAQAVAADFIREGHFARHLRRTRALYRERRRALVDAIRSQLGEQLEVRGDEAGMHLVATLSRAAEAIARSPCAPRGRASGRCRSPRATSAGRRAGASSSGSAARTSARFRRGVRKLRARTSREPARSEFIDTHGEAAV